MKKSLLIVFVLTGVLFCLYAGIELFTPARSMNRNIEIEIPKGSTFRQAVEILFREGLIRDPKVFLVFGRLTGADRRIRAGFYSLWAHMNPFEILQILRKGKIVEYEVRILEGDSLPEIAEAFGAAGILGRDDFMKLAHDRDFLAAHNIGAPSMEGFIYPDTYFIPKGMKPEDAVSAMIGKMREKFTEKVMARMGQLGITENDVLTLASIIEKEAVIDSERALISAVYHNRLRKHMPLQADPTAIYGIKSSKEKITLSDLRRKTPYNTYVIKGLPPGPIASPGLKSIIAALFPEDVQYLYFVSQDDRSHRFATTETEHAENVRLYRIRQQEMKEAEKEETRDNGSS